MGEKNFHSCVDEYIKSCEELGRKPQKAYKGVFNVRIDPELHKKLYKEALKSGVSLNSFISNVLSSEIKRVAC
jgi:predicted HicB family RNase H-like nuclease